MAVKSDDAYLFLREQHFSADEHRMTEVQSIVERPGRNKNLRSDDVMNWKVDITRFFLIQRFLESIGDD